MQLHISILVLDHAQVFLIHSHVLRLADAGDGISFDKVQDAFEAVGFPASGVNLDVVASELSRFRYFYAPLYFLGVFGKP